MPKGNPQGYNFRMPEGKTKGNKDLPINRSESKSGGSASKDGPSGKFHGTTKGNKDLPINRTEGVKTGQAGTHIAGRNRPY